MTSKTREGFSLKITLKRVYCCTEYEKKTKQRKTNSLEGTIKTQVSVHVERYGQAKKIYENSRGGYMGGGSEAIDNNDSIFVTNVCVENFKDRFTIPRYIRATVPSVRTGFCIRTGHTIIIVPTHLHLTYISEEIFVCRVIIT